MGRPSLGRHGVPWQHGATGNLSCLWWPLLRDIRAATSLPPMPSSVAVGGPRSVQAHHPVEVDVTPQPCTKCAHHHAKPAGGPPRLQSNCHGRTIKTNLFQVERIKPVPCNPLKRGVWQRIFRTVQNPSGNLKTAVRESVPGVRMPLPPPL